MDIQDKSKEELQKELTELQREFYSLNAIKDIDSAKRIQLEQELAVAYKEISLQNEEKGKRAAELIIANLKLKYDNEEKEKRAAKLVIANIELVFQNKEKANRAAELVIANKELFFQNEEKGKRAAELIIANKAIAFQSELIIAQEKAAKSEERFALAIDASEQGIWDWNVETNEVFFSKQWKKQIGYNDDELKNDLNTWLEHLHPDETEYCQNALNSYIIEPVEHFVLEFRFRHKDGTYRWIHNKAASVKNNEGKVIRMFGSHTDITEQKRTIDALKESEEMMISSQSVAHICSYSTNLNVNELDKSVWVCSPEFYNVFGIDETYPHTIAGWAGFIHPDHREELVAYHEHVVKSGISFNHEYKIIRIKDGAERWVEGTGELEYDELGKPVRMYGAIQDITERKQVEATLLKSEKQFRQLAESMPQIVWITQPDGLNIFFNQQWVDYTGLTMEESYGDGWNKPFHPDDQQRAWDAWQNATTHLATYSLECRLRRFDGEYKWWLIRGVPVLDEHGTVNKWFGTCTDINEMKLTEAELYEKEIKFHNLANSGPALIWTSGTDKLCNYFNEGWMAFTGRTLEQEIGNGWAEGVHPEDFDYCLATYIAAFDRQEPFEMEYRLRHVSGEYRWILDLGTPNFKSTGEFNGYIGNCFDITDRKQNEESLLMLKTAIEKSEVSVVITDSKGNIEYANPFFTVLTGYSVEEYMGQNPKVLKSNYHPDEFYKEMWDTINSGKTWEGEFYNRKKNGEYYWENAILSPVENDKNEITHFVAIKTDITEAKKIQYELCQAKEHAEESDRLKSAFLANMSHEIRTPMNGILGFTDLLQDPDLSSEEKKSYIGLVHKSGQRMLNTVNDIIEISKIEAGMVLLNKGKTNVNKKVSELVQFFGSEAAAKGLTLSIEKSLPEADSIILTDAQKLYSILNNLIKNAIKFTDHGSIKVGCSLKEKLLEFYVCDTGIGIPADRKEAIFDRFVQADIADKRAFQGSGLGLSISKANVEILGGTIWVESEEHKGSTFYFTLPYDQENTEEQQDRIVTSLHQNVSRKSNNVNGLKILIAEDDEVSDMLISIMTEQFGREILKADNGKSAVEICQNNSDINLILMDLKMPVMDGMEATRQIRQFNKDVIIIAQTAYGLTGDREKAIEAGCNEHISKPIRSEELKELLMKYFHK